MQDAAVLVLHLKLARDDWILLLIRRRALWTQLRHLSPMDRKYQKAESHVVKAAAGGTGLFDGLGGQRLIHHMSRSAYFP
jgi:hypothetical protein